MKLMTEDLNTFKSFNITISIDKIEDFIWLYALSNSMIPNVHAAGSNLVKKITEYELSSSQMQFFNGMQEIREKRELNI